MGVRDILIQKREKNRVAYPGYWDISASGHVSAGESSLEAAQRVFYMFTSWYMLLIFSFILISLIMGIKHK